MRRRSCLALLALAALAALPTMPALAADAPALLLAQVYRPGLPLADYWVSEKYDGVRGFWDGRTLRTRGGETVAAPASFTAGWPQVPMDGELWAAMPGAWARCWWRCPRASAFGWVRASAMPTATGRRPWGSWVTYRFRGTHDGGLPRFASFVRVREDMPAR